MLQMWGHYILSKYSYDTETGQVRTVGEYDHSAYAGVGADRSTPSSWMIATTIVGHSDWPIGKRVYKKWILVVNNISGEVRQYMVYTK